LPIKLFARDLLIRASLEKEKALHRLADERHCSAMASLPAQPNQQRVCHRKRTVIGKFRYFFDNPNASCLCASQALPRDLAGEKTF
jgi:hypothetical protein